MFSISDSFLWHHQAVGNAAPCLVSSLARRHACLTPLRRSRSFKVTDFCINRKLIYNFLLVINTNLPTILQRFQVMADNWMLAFKNNYHTNDHLA